LWLGFGFVWVRVKVWVRVGVRSVRCRVRVRVTRYFCGVLRAPLYTRVIVPRQKSPSSLAARFWL
jgi:hypothetical protein